MRYLHTDTVRISELHPYPGNARVHDDASLDESAKLNGQFRAIVARTMPDGTLQILAGHGTCAAFERAGDTAIRVEVIDADDTEARRIVLADNATTRNASYDDYLLRALLDEASSDGGLSGTGWDGEAYRKLLNASENPFDFQPDDDELARLDETKAVSCPECGHSFLP